MKSGTAVQPSERIAVVLLCVIGILHVFIFSAAFPFFSVVDEQVHLDLAVRYSQGELPRHLTPPCAEALPFIAIYGTPEYLWVPASHPHEKIAPPSWKQPLETVREKIFEHETAYRTAFLNYEVASPPLYYGLAGAWWRLGRVLGLDGIDRLYWMRFLNIPLVVLVVWLGWLTARYIFPENIFIRLAVPALVAFLPQSTFYIINNDVLSPLTFGVALLLLLKFSDAEMVSARLGLAAGLALAAAFLSKASNLPLLAAAGAFLMLKILVLLRQRRLRPALGPGLLLALAALLPLAAWMAWCKANFGDFLGAAAKTSFLGWTDKPVAEWLHHPIFSRSGFWYFLKGNLATLWQGEAEWHRQPLALPAVDSAYAVLTLGALALMLVALLHRPPAFATPQQSALWLAFLCVASSFAFFALLSVKYDFHDCFYPSHDHPFFVSGRLLLGMLVPFLVLFACGLDRLMKHVGNATKFFVLLGLLAFMLASEISLDLPVFFSEYNWFHL